MKVEDTKLYTSADTYFNGPDGMKNEVAMWYVAGGLLIRELAIRKGNLPFGGLGKTPGYTINPTEKDSLSVLDLCSGPGNFVNHLSFAFPWMKVLCIDLNENFLKAGAEQFTKREFKEGDATNFQIESRFDCITASSAYHHIEDEKKIEFLKTIKSHLAEDGFAIICENFLPEYTSDEERIKSVNLYYDELIKYYGEGNATEESIKAIDEVFKLELAKVEEHKVPHAFFQKQVEEAGLKIDLDVVAWSTDKLKSANAGSHVIILKHFIC